MHLFTLYLMRTCWWGEHWRLVSAIRGLLPIMEVSMIIQGVGEGELPFVHGNEEIADSITPSLPCASPIIPAKTQQ